MRTQRTLRELADLLGADLRGDGGLTITGVASLDSAGPGQLSFFASPKYRDQLRVTRAEAVLVPPGEDCARPHLVSRDPYADFARVVAIFAPPLPRPPAGVHPLAAVHPGATLGAGVAVGPACVVGDGVVVGDRTVLAAQVFLGDGCRVGQDCWFHPGVVVREGTEIGSRVILHPNVVLGADGFGFAPVGAGYLKIPQIGKVVIEDDVEIGACTCVDRAALGETRIGRGSKLDNLIQVAHNVTIGPDTVIAAQTGISGSSRLGRHVTLGGQVGVTGHIQVGDQVTVGAQSGISNDVPARAFLFGTPARPYREVMKQLAALVRLPDLLAKFRALEERLRRIEEGRK